MKTIPVKRYVVVDVVDEAPVRDARPYWDRCDRPTLKCVDVLTGYYAFFNAVDYEEKLKETVLVIVEDKERP